MKVIFYKSQSGRDEISQYLLKQSVGSQAEFYGAINALKVYGFDLPPKLLKKLKGQKKLWELRIQAEVQHRILFTVVKTGEAVLLNCFVKKSQQTPVREIKTALNRKTVYEKS